MNFGFGFIGRSSARGILAGMLFVASAMMCSSASADIVAANCGAPLKSVVKSLVNGSFSTTSHSYVNVPNARVVINVPAGQTQCIKVRFSASAACATPVPDTTHCFIRASEASIIAFSPVAVFSSEPFIAAHSFEWASRLSAGSHEIQIQAATSGDTFNINNWTFSVEVAK